MPETIRKPLTWFKVSPQVRIDLGSESDLRNLGESLRERQLSPVGALENGELIYGFRRLKAAEVAALLDLTVTIYKEPLSAAEIQSIQLTENIHRLDMSPFEKWRAYEALKEHNPDWSAKDLANHLKLDPSAVTKWLSPSKCSKAWQDAFAVGLVNISDCYVASQASADQQALLLTMKHSGSTADGLSQAVRRTRRQATTKAVRSARVTVPLPSGTKITISGEDLSLQDVIDQLTECLQAARSGLRQDLDVKTWQSVMGDKSRAAGGVTSHA